MKVKKMDISATHYDRFSREDFILRDYLAIDRTVLANERTFLAYIRTALTIFIAGVTFVKFFASLIIIITGWIFLPLGFGIFIVGFLKFNTMRRQMSKIEY